MVRVGSGQDGIGLPGSASGHSFPPTGFITAILVGDSIHRSSSTGLLSFTIATTTRIASASFTSLTDMVLSRPEAFAAEDTEGVSRRRCSPGRSPLIGRREDPVLLWVTNFSVCDRMIRLKKNSEHRSNQRTNIRKCIERCRYFVSLAVLIVVPVLFFATASVVANMQGKSAEGTSVTVLVYHRFGPVVADAMTVRTSAFAPCSRRKGRSSRD